MHSLWPKKEEEKMHLWYYLKFSYSDSITFAERASRVTSWGRQAQCPHELWQKGGRGGAW